MMNKLAYKNVISVKEALEFLGYSEDIFEEYSTMDFEDELADKLGYRYEFNLERFGDHDRLERHIYLNKF